MKKPRIYVSDVFEDSGSLEEIMVKAIKLEVEASNNYEAFLKLPLSDPLRKKIKRLKFQEEQHENTFRSIFNDFFPNREPELPKKSGLSSYSFEVTRDSELVDVLAGAKHSEKEFELFYDNLIAKFNDKHVRSLIGFLAASEREHYEILRAEISNLQGESTS
jgi:rubrerythrin